MLDRTKRTQGIQRRRYSVNGHAQDGSAPPAPPRLAHEPRPAAQRLTNDQAFYSCQCGYVFKAPVSTSVDCPHCGGAQAW